LSWKATAYVKTLGRGQVSRSEKLLMFVLADYHNTETRDAWPSVPTLAEEALMSQRQVQYCLRSLENKRLLSVKRVIDGTSRYSFPDIDGGAKSAPGVVQDLHQGGAESSCGVVQNLHPSGAIAVAPKPPENLQLEPPKEQHPPTPSEGECELLFNQLWEVYPRKLGKVKAFRAFQKLNPTPDLLKEITAAVEGYKLVEQWRRGNSYVPYLATFLNQRRWLDCYPELPIGARGGLGLQPIANPKGSREAEWRKWTQWADARPLDKLKKEMSIDIEVQPAWAQPRIREYLRERETKECSDAAASNVGPGATESAPVLR
jgi:hypothetical protein